MKSILLAFHMLVLVIAVPGVSAREPFIPGYVVLNTGDTLYGEIRDRNLDNDQLYKKIRFRGEHSGKRKFSPYQIRGYRIGNEEFESVWFDEQTAFFIFHYFCREGVGEKIFLKVLQRGKLTCFYREYIDADSGTLDGYELFKREGEDYYARATQGILGLKKKRLSDYFTDCPSLIRKIQNGEIRDPLEVVAYYNRQCGAE